MRDWAVTIMDGKRGHPMLAFSSPTALCLSESDLDVVVTGAGGWIGRATLEMLESVLGGSLTRRVHAYGSTGRALRLRSGTELECQPLGKLEELAIGPHLLVHLAYKTREHVALGSRGYIDANESISNVVLAHGRRSEVAGIFYPSSGAVYGGSLANDAAENPYGPMKRRDEERFGTLGHRTENTAVIRVFNLAGPFLNKPELYVLGSIIEDLIRGGPIRLRADHPVIRSYIHVQDLVDLAFALMLGLVASPGEPFDTAGEIDIEVGELAGMAASILGSPDVPIQRPVVPDNAAPDRYVGDGTIMMELASRYGLCLSPLERQIVDTADFLRQ
jgi:UDP-glucuronate decarboxylase